MQIFYLLQHQIYCLFPTETQLTKFVKQYDQQNGHFILP